MFRRCEARNSGTRRAPINKHTLAPSQTFPVLHQPAVNIRLRGIGNVWLGRVFTGEPQYPMKLLLGAAVCVRRKRLLLLSAQLKGVKRIGCYRSPALLAGRR